VKLFFPNGEHAAVDLVDGVTTLGSSPTCDIALNASGVMPRHCEIQAQGTRCRLEPLALAPTLVNSVQITAGSEIKGGDLLSFGSVICRLIATERRAPPVAAAPVATAGDDGRTRMRMALPKFVLRGVSGVTFGKLFPVHGSMRVGRSSDCDICIQSDEISRHHARLQLVPDGVMVEDTASANGTYVNDQRVTAPTLLKPGGELRMDVVRFLLVAPGRETENLDPALATRPLQQAAPLKTTRPAWFSAVAISAGLLLVAIVIIGLGYALHYF
jgi:pSer/pThr/pTyr-binding forkhead associated (FHA) protein